jgi:hypothetical protein
VRTVARRFVRSDRLTEVHCVGQNKSSQFRQEASVTPLPELRKALIRTTAVTLLPERRKAFVPGYCCHIAAGAAQSLDPAYCYCYLPNTTRTQSCHHRSIH